MPLSLSQTPPMDNDSGLLATLYKDPESISNQPQYKQLPQWRPISWNPFDRCEEDEAGSDEAHHNLLKHPPEILLELSMEAKTAEAEPKQLLNPGPAWVTLFYDLAWTATFSSLTQNGQFDTQWDSVSYSTFFVLVWWLWASQVLYDVNFYTNDCFHLGSIFLQLGVFGLLAATTHGFDVTTYILHSPGSPNTLDPQPIEEITDPDRYNSEVTARMSTQVIAFSIALSRMILLLQYLRVLAYAHHTAWGRRGRIPHIPQQLYFRPAGLFISTALFLTAWSLTRSEFGTSVLGAKLKYILWGFGLMVEVLSYVRVPQISLNRPRLFRRFKLLWKGKAESPSSSPGPTKPAPPNLTNRGLHPLTVELPILQSSVTLRSRLESITTIILGEGINGIAGTLHSIISAPGLECPIVTNIISTGFIVYFLAYLYFEGPSGYMDPRNKARRKVYWLLVHFPFLLYVVLLLQGVKNQFLLTSFLSTARTMARDLDTLDDELVVVWSQPNLRSNTTIIRRLIQYGIAWPQEYDMLAQNMSRSGPLPANASVSLSSEQKDEIYIWHWRLSVRTLMKIYELFMDQAGVPEETQSRIDDYLQNMTAPRHDHYTPSDSLGDHNYYQIVEAVLNHAVQGARYTVVFAGLVIILLGALDLAHAKPHDRFQCGAIISRFLMGLTLILVLLFNLNGGQHLWVNKGHEHERAGVFSWVSSYCILPIIALAFGIEYLIEIILVWRSASVREGGNTHFHAPLAQMAWHSLKQVIMNPFGLYHKHI